MAQTRVEKVGTIYTRISSLIYGGAKAETGKPLWYTIYEAFPPKYEPKYDRVTPYIPIRPIYYKEDVIRARFHQDCKNLDLINLSNKKYPSQTKKFLDTYNELRMLNLSDEAAYEQALEKFNFSSANIED
ncbi:28S ribosomal protein S23, mitochondrial [Vespa crabro]|uniref:28S ribosomal protein S23, mitochondrial n=1 Tax=Vespa crabro TaxID=7445 RepID=UPI001EFFBC93|nr:28S ribosomal protein S23, mitochondrial [Vespa crabro]XP_046818684.1 28S ribosomal protein S23, mitochondrial [Vespa crabro]XP_046818693.1 28S ribosomal protein S23, mitochondrial [Vespa crabro]XP_046818703.1 28S ribosomal protein S23, mitochondrial [Vespa crabro]XP_046818714.1 28S ribosomal protein S23, mitochondrial [Vespa crabro]